ncbi:hypothetical protein TcasGA2_TC034578 [Tribolium castaneum]|uniref:Uncharacterized protein n=1 Tax=Tribolium castaneum TaxID=7070 RepID=A0A139WLY6_TRICA|nr:hypothetical protein TcasGA2_TC034578 [Tribolium castaneum]
MKLSITVLLIASIYIAEGFFYYTPYVRRYDIDRNRIVANSFSPRTLPARQENPGKKKTKVQPRKGYYNGAICVCDDKDDDILFDDELATVFLVFGVTDGLKAFEDLEKYGMVLELIELIKPESSHLIENADRGYLNARMWDDNTYY